MPKLGKRGRDTRSVAKKASDAAKVARALELAKLGLTFQVIAQQCGYNSRQAAHKAVMGALQRIESVPAKEFLTLSLERLDRLLSGLVGKNAYQGEVAEAMAALRVIETQLRLKGYLRSEPPTVGTVVLNVTPEVADAIGATPEYPALNGATH